MVVARREGAEDLQDAAMLADLVDGGLDLRVVRVALQVDEEEILPRPGLAGTGFDFHQVEAAALEGLHRMDERADLVLHAEGEARLVRPGWSS